MTWYCKEQYPIFLQLSILKNLIQNWRCWAPKTNGAVYFRKILIYPFWAKGTKNGPKKVFILIFGKDCKQLDFSWNSRKRKLIIVICFLAQTLYLENFLFFIYWPKYSCPIRFQDSSNCNISRKSGVVLIFYM